MSRPSNLMRTGARSASDLIAESIRTQVTVEAEHSPELAAALERDVARENGRVVHIRTGATLYEGAQDTRLGYSRLPRWAVRLSPSDEIARRSADPTFSLDSCDHID